MVYLSLSGSRDSLQFIVWYETLSSPDFDSGLEDNAGTSIWFLLRDKFPKRKGAIKSKIEFYQYCISDDDKFIK